MVILKDRSGPVNLIGYWGPDFSKWPGNWCPLLATLPFEKKQPFRLPKCGRPVTNVIGLAVAFRLVFTVRNWTPRYAPCCTVPSRFWGHISSGYSNWCLEWVGRRYFELPLHLFFFLHNQHYFLMVSQFYFGNGLAVNFEWCQADFEDTFQVDTLIDVWNG